MGSKKMLHKKHPLFSVCLVNFLACKTGQICVLIGTSRGAMDAHVTGLTFRYLHSEQSILIEHRWTCIFKLINLKIFTLSDVKLVYMDCKKFKANHHSAIHVALNTSRG